MNLESVATVQATYDAADDETKRLCDIYSAEMRTALSTSLPALNETDLAAVSWYVTEVLSAASDLIAQGRNPVALLNLSVSAYALATVELLGWKT